MTAVAVLPGGQVNHTYRVDQTDRDPVVLRFPVDPAQPDTFPVEAWAARAAARAGVPTAGSLGHGVLDGVPYSFWEYVEPDAEPPRRPWTVPAYDAARAALGEDAPRG